MNRWNLTNSRELAVTPTSHVYTVTYQNETVVLKLLTPVGIHDEQHGATALRCYDGHGAVRLLASTEEAHLLEYAEGDDLIPMVDQGDDDGATRIIAEVLNQLHASSSATGDGLIPLRRRFRSLFQYAERQNDDSIFVRAAWVADRLLNDQRELRVLHGDLHHGNIRHSARRGWLAFDPKGLYGERTFDVANTLCNPGSMPTLVEDEARLLRQADILADCLHLHRSRILMYVFAYACLSASWTLGSGGDASDVLCVAAHAQRYMARS
jgi:streptomycin 6-kinase